MDPGETCSSTPLSGGDLPPPSPARLLSSKPPSPYINASPNRRGHRHTQSLGLLSPPSRSSLTSEESSSSASSVSRSPGGYSVISNSNSPLAHSPSRGSQPGTPITPGTPILSSSAKARRTSLSNRLPPLPSLLSGLNLSSLLPSNAKTVGMPSSPITPASPTLNAHSRRATFGFYRTSNEDENVPVHAPQPRRASQSTFAPGTATPSRSEQLLRDALRRGSPVPQPSKPTSPAPHSRSRTPQVYGGHEEGGAASMHLARALSRLEGRGGSAAEERDPDHEALRARLERVLAGGSPRVSLDGRRKTESMESTSSAGSCESPLPMSPGQPERRTPRPRTPATPTPSTPHSNKVTRAYTQLPDITMATPSSSPRSPRSPHAGTRSPLPPSSQSRTYTHLSDTTMASLNSSPRSPRSPHSSTRSPPPPPIYPDIDLARRNTAPAATSSPRRSSFAFKDVVDRGQTPSPSPGRVRTRARTEPVGGDADLARWQVEQQQMHHRRGGHARKSSAYASLMALQGPGPHPGYGAAHHAYPAQSASARMTSPGSTPPLSADVRDEDTSESESAGAEVPRKMLLTPPGTPPQSIVNVAGEDEFAAADDDEEDVPRRRTEYMHLSPDGSRSTFNARKASAQCRQLEGYVSFAAVEGLGEPPSPGPDGDASDEEDATRKAKRGSLGSGLVGLLKTGFW